MKLSRRDVARAVIGAPVVLFAASVARLESLLGWKEARAAQAPEPSPTPEESPADSALGRFLAREEEGLSEIGRASCRERV